MKKLLFSMFLLSFLALGLQAGLNDPAVVNGSFEDPDLAAEGRYNGVNDWFDSVAYTYTQDDALANVPDTPYGDNWAELGNERWAYQQIGTYEENMELDISFLLGQKSDKLFQGIHVSILVGGDPALAADFNSKYYTENPLVTVVGAVEIFNSGPINPFATNAIGVSEQALAVSTGTGYAVGAPLWIQINKVAGTGRTLVDNVKVEFPTTANLVAPVNNAPRVAIDSDLEWSAPAVINGTLQSYTLTYRQGDPNWADPGNTLVENATSPYDMGVMPYATDYFWRVDVVTSEGTVEGKTWAFTTVPEVPVITQKPEGQLVADGSEATFAITGLNIANYQWKKVDGTLPAGATGADTATLTIPGVTQADEGMYYCTVDNGKGDTLDSGAVLLMTERLVAHFEFESTLTDSQGNLGTGVVIDPNDADTLPADVGFGEGIIGSGALALGVNIDPEAIEPAYNQGFVELPDSAGAMKFFPLGMTVSAWMKVVDGSYYMATIAEARKDAVDLDDDGINDIAATSSFLFNRYYGRGRFKADGNLVTDSLVPDPEAGIPDMNDGQWHLITGTFDGTTGDQKIYIDGIFSAMTTQTLDKTVFANTEDVLRIGGQQATNVGNVDRPVIGYIDDLKIYSYPVTAERVAELYLESGMAEWLCLDAEGLELDFNGDCIVNVEDFAVFANSWMNSRRVYPVGE
ncbi:MAG: immunoglobulin domain-containing protein [Phycisphaerae bacterium]|nr:immunoglobulin domain-containing protein [Phycisphaerae bacterium]